MYESYWSRPDRWGTHSFDDARALSDQVLGVCGPGRVLDAGCGMGLLVRTLLSRGIDAVGMDVAPACVSAGNDAAPGRFVEGSALALPFADGSFETVISTDVLEHLEERDIERAIAEMMRVARRSIFVRVSTEPDRDATWHLTVKPREWWERKFIDAGLRKHPASHRAVAYHALEDEGAQVTMIFEKLPAPAGERYPLDSLRAGRDLHMDMLREAGRRSDAHVARYAYAAPFVRAGDVVLDAACGMGYGAAVLARTTPASLVIGVDADGAAVGYARANYGEDEAAPGVVEFRESTLPDLSFLADRSVDLVACFETLEHVADPAALLAEFERVLTPGGRLVVSVPNEWTDASGKDPNPYHCHVYTWDRLGSELAAKFLLERASAQTAGGGMKHPDAPRAIVEASFAEDSPEPGDARHHALKDPPAAEWWLAVAMKSPISAGRDGYRESAYPGTPSDAAYHLTSFGRDYDNPWLVRSIVSIGARATRPSLLRRLARAVIETGRPGSPGVGAALCVLAYRELERFEEGTGDARSARELLAALDEYDGRADDSPHGWRWRISNRYAAGLLLLCLGDRATARGVFENCASMDCLRFSPLLASKTIDAAFQAGTIAAADGDAEGSRAMWTRGVREARRVLSGEWLNVLGDPERPVVFGLPEVAIVADAAGRCAYALDMSWRRPAEGAQAWAAGQTQAIADLRRWAQSLLGARGWLRSEVQRHRQVTTEQARTIVELRDWTERQRQGTDWLQQAVARHTAEIAELRRAREWATSQAEGWRTTAERHERTVSELRAWSESLAEGRDRLTAQIGQRDATIAELRAWAAELTTGRDWLDGQRAALAALAETRARSLSALAEHATNLKSALGERESQIAALRDRLAAAEDRLRRASGRVVELTARCEALDRATTARVRQVMDPAAPVPLPGAPRGGNHAPAPVEPKPVAGNDPGLQESGTGEARAAQREVAAARRPADAVREM